MLSIRGDFTMTSLHSSPLSLQKHEPAAGSRDWDAKERVGGRSHKSSAGRYDVVAPTRHGIWGRRRETKITQGISSLFLS